MAVHEWVQGWCKHCGASESGYQEAISLGYGSTCLERQAEPSAHRPEPERRVYASEDYDTINSRLGELRGERDAALNAEPVMAPESWEGEHEHL